MPVQNDYLIFGPVTICGDGIHFRARVMERAHDAGTRFHLGPIALVAFGLALLVFVMLASF